MKKLIMLVGLPGSGKSFWTNNFLKTNPSFKVMSTDNIIEDLCSKEGLNYSQGFGKFIGQASAKFDQDVKTAFNNGDDMIIDRTNMSIKSRKKFLNMARENGYTFEAVYFNVAEPTLKKRLDERAQTTGKHIPKDVVDSMARNFDMPTKDEGFSKISTIRG